MKSLFLFILLFACCTVSAFSFNFHKPIPSNFFHSAVILQYHNISTETADITSISPKQFKAHIDWLEKNHFEILPLGQVVNTLKSGDGFKHTHIAAITFDDAHISVCTEAWELLKKKQIPFTVFINSEAVDSNYVSQCSWEQLKTMSDSGLMTAANHGHKHLHMVRHGKQSYKDWKKQMQQEIETTQALIQKHIGTDHKLFAYPYGEYNEELSELVKGLGFIGFGQHSGAIGTFSDFTTLPRFPASGQYANLETLSVKLMSLAFPGQVTPLNTNPVSPEGKDNPPKLKLSPEKDIGTLTCFDSSTGKPIQVKQYGKDYIAQHHSKLGEGRTRYNCTSPSEEAKRFYWISHQWLVQ
jgi:peptidoglycan/xylan/chitin deacetylase (PgdA/CDA1 family)